MLGIYCRISQEKEEGKDRSIDYQKEVGIALAKKLGLNYKVYIDEGISGTWDIDKRPQLNQMMDDISEGLITSVFVLEQSRLERNTQVRFIINQTFIDNDVRLFTETGEIDLHNEESNFMGDMMSLMNSFAVKVTKRKVKAVLKKNAREGKAHGILPYGYTTDKDNKIIVCPQRSLVVKDVFKMSLSGIGFKNIATELNARGIPTYYNKKGSKWSHGSVRGILKNESYTGVRKFGDEVFEMPMIIPKRIFDKAQANLVKNMTTGGKVYEYDYMLNGLCRCGKCGKTFNGRYIKGQKFVYYQCVSKRLGKNSCGNLAVRSNELEKLLYEVYFRDGRIVELASQYFIADDYRVHISSLTKRFKEIEQEVKKNALKKSKVIEAVIEGLLTKADVRSELNKIEEENNALANETEMLKDKVERIKESVKNNITLEMDIKAVKSADDMGNVIRKYLSRVDVQNDGEDIKIEVEFTMPNFKLDVITLKSDYSSYSIDC